MDISASLPDPKGPLSDHLPTASIAEANREVLKAVAEAKEPRNKGPYIKVTPECKAQVAKFASINGNSVAARKYTKILGKKLNKSTVHLWVKNYKLELERKRKAGDIEPDVQVLPTAKRGRPFLLGEKLDGQTQAYIRAVREAGGVITTGITIAAGKAIVRKFNPTLFGETNGPALELTPNWAKSLLYRMGFAKRKGCSTKKLMVHNSEEIKEQFLNDIVTVANMEDIPDDLILNWDHTAINIVPVSSWTMNQKGEKRVEIVGLDDKRQITAVLCGALSGEILPFQLIYQGKTSACLPKVKLPKDWLLSFTPNHWPNEDKTEEYIHSVLLPYLEKKGAELGLSNTFPVVVLFDASKGQTTERIYQLLEANNVYTISVPANCADKLQPMDLSINKILKDFMKKECNEWYSSAVYETLDAENPTPADLRMAVMKPLGVQWLLKAYRHLMVNKEIIQNGFKAAGIADSLKEHRSL